MADFRKANPRNEVWLPLIKIINIVALMLVPLL